MSRLTPAQRHLQKVTAAKAAAVAEALAPTLAPPKTEAPPLATAPVNLQPTPAQRHLLKHHAIVASAAAAAAAIAAGGVANDNASGLELTAYERMAGQLAEDRKALKRIESVERKIVLKADLVGRYDGYVDDALAAAKAAGGAAQDDVLVWQMIWRADVGLWKGALTIAEHVMRYRLAMPDPYRRGCGAFIAEQSAEAALKALAAGAAFDSDVLDDVQILVEGEDMPDEVKAKLHKAVGLLILRRAETPLEEGASVPAGFPRTAFEEAKTHLLRAVDLHAKVGVKKDLERIERELKKDPADA